MNGPDHYREAERLLDGAADLIADGVPVPAAQLAIAAAGVHAALADAAAQALRLLRDFSTTVAADDQLEAACAAWAEAIR